MITIYNVLYSKPLWTKETAIDHMTENGVDNIIECEENDSVLCFTLALKPETDTLSSRMLPITESVCLVIKDLRLPDSVALPQPEDEKKDASSSSSVGSC